MADQKQKHPAEVLADELARMRAQLDPVDDWREPLDLAGAALRRIPALEAERDRLLADMRRASQALAWGAERMPEMDQAYEQAAQAIAACADKEGL